MAELPVSSIGLTPAAADKAYIGTKAGFTLYHPYAVDGDTATIEWKFGAQSGKISNNKIAVSSALQVVCFWDIPITLYNEIPETQSGTLDIKCHIYGKSGEKKFTLQGTATLYALETYCAPTISLPTVYAVDDLTVRLTGDDANIIRYVSTARVNVRAEAKFNTRLSLYVWNGDSEAECVGFEVPDSIDGYCDLYKISTNIFHVQAGDARGFVTKIKYTLPAERFVEYIKLTCNADHGLPDTYGNMRLSCSGNYFNASFGAVHNSLRVEYRYKENDGEFTEWATMTASTNENSYSAYVELTGLNYKSKYTFECRAIDEAMTANSADFVAKSTPVFEWGENDFAFNVPVDFRAGITVNGNESDIIVEQGESGNWQYRKWQSGRAECWGRFTRSVYSSDWTAWGSLYQAEIIMNEAYPFTFTDTQKEIATLHSLSGGLLNSNALGMTQSTTGAHFAVHPNKLTSTYTYILELYVVGRWK